MITAVAAKDGMNRIRRIHRAHDVHGLRCVLDEPKLPITLSKPVREDSLAERIGLHRSRVIVPKQLAFAVVRKPQCSIVDHRAMRLRVLGQRIVCHEARRHVDSVDRIIRRGDDPYSAYPISNNRCARRIDTRHWNACNN